MSWPRTWWVALAALATLRIAAPLVALAAEGRDLPGFPRFDLVAETGDDAGFYSATREFMAAIGRVPLPLLVLLGVAAIGAAVVTVRLWPRRQLRPWLVVGLALIVSLAVSVVILEMASSGAAVFGWSLLWTIPLLPYRALGLPLDYEIAFAFAFPLSLAANVIALFATAYAGFYATGRRAVGLAAAAALAIWPLVSIVVAGGSAWDNGTWFVDTGLALYTEPLSTALVASALALLLRPERTDVQLALAGVLLSYATFVKLSNALVGVIAVLAVAAFLGLRRVLPLAAGGLSFAPAVAAYWPLGYLDERTGRYFARRDAFSLDYLGPNWTESLLFSPRTLLVLLPFAMVGVFAVRRGLTLALLLGVTLVNPIFYSFYAWTPGHPRFLFASLPSFFVLWAAGLLAVVERLARRSPTPAPTRG
jgi:hypothetical protein